MNCHKTKITKIINRIFISTGLKHQVLCDYYPSPIGGEGGIRTLGNLAATRALQARALDHYATSPYATSPDMPIISGFCAKIF